MAYDWKRLEREDNERSDRAALSFGLMWVGIGIVGPLIAFLVTGSFDWISALVWLAVGLVALMPAAVAVRKAHKGGRAPEERPP